MEEVLQFHFKSVTRRYFVSERADVSLPVVVTAKLEGTDLELID